MPTPTDDDIANHPLQSWDDVDGWLLTEARTHARLRLVPETTAYVLHGGVTTLLIRPPTPCAADAHHVGAALAHMIHPMQPDQVLVTFPGRAAAAGTDPGDTLQAMAGERGSAWRHLRVPLPHDRPHAGVRLTTIPTPPPWAVPVQAVFDDVAPPPPDVSTVHHRGAEFVMAVNPDGPAAGLGSRWP